MMAGVRPWVFALAMALAAMQANAEIRFRTTYEDDPDEPKWQEQEAALPGFPKDESLMEFYVSANTPNRFFVDGTTLNPGADGVVRYVLVVRTSGGATNVTFEGIRCATRELRLYATGRTDGTWAKARISEWKRIENKPVNRHHAALSRDYLCPAGGIIESAEDGREGLKLGKHPRAL